ncbi:MAG: putative DsbA family dithiol-disulfide isomerase [Pseudohongiellaceae bacterium]|jgi:predicted DsbA family dithiol-disulfide isomerase
MKNEIKIDIVSDVSCPWCVIGYRSLQSALEEAGVAQQTSLNWLPFELNPDMPKQGQNISEHIQQKYGSTAEQSAANRENIKQRGLDLGYEFSFAEDGRIYNTFDAHRLLHWANQFDLQTELKLALFDLYFQQRKDPSDHATLIECAVSIGLDPKLAKDVLDSDRFTQELREQQDQSRQHGISAVPAFIFDGKYLVSGGQPKDVFIDVIYKLTTQ